MTSVPRSIGRVVGYLVAAGLAFPSEPAFLARRDYHSYAYGIGVADANNDKIPDVIWVGRDDEIGVLLGYGNGTFRQGPTSKITMGVSLGAPVATDLDGDGNVDIITSGGEGSSAGFGVCFGNGKGGFQPAVFYPTGTDIYPGNVVLGDFNGDGIPDAVLATESGIWVFTGKGGGAFNPGALTPLSGLSYVNNQSVAADFNNDGKLDLAVTTSTGFAILFGNGDGAFQAPENVTAARGGYYIAAGDLNLDGYPDIVLGTATDYAPVYLNNGAGAFVSPINANISSVQPIGIGDVNGDGVPDLVSSVGYIALGNGNGTFKPPRYYPLPGGISNAAVVLADLRHNGLTDLVFQDPSGNISVLLSFGKGKYEDGEWTKITGGAGCGASADYNHDGKPDLAVNTPSGVSILLGTGNALSPFKTGAAIALPPAGCLVTGDLNGDGIADLLVPSNGTVVAYLGHGDGTFTQKSTTATPSGGYLALGDFNHDGKLDFATSGNLLALGNGDGTFQTPVQIGANLNGLTNIAADDLNGDGWTDLVLTYYYDSYIYVLLNNQHGGFTENMFHAVNSSGYPINPGQVLLVDVNGDSNLDMVVGGVSGGADVYLGNGKGAFTYKGEPPNSGFGLGPLVAVGDINGDGIPDLVTGTVTLAVYLGKGDGTFQNRMEIGAGPSPGDIILVNLHGQAAGYADVVAPDLTGGVMVLINNTK